ncbi:MAG: hypothetical protein KY476_08220 [Planctomycetes bacterium]|nr:hypothetical protein [Planctomycetota bacterium]
MTERVHRTTNWLLSLFASLAVAAVQPPANEQNAPDADAPTPAPSPGADASQPPEPPRPSPELLVPPRPAEPPTAEERTRLRELLDRINNQIELDARLGGAYLVDGTFVSAVDSPDRMLRLRGKIVTEEQRPLLESVVVETLESLPYWQSLPDAVAPDLRAVAIVPLSSVLTQRYLEIGINALWECDVWTANRAFARAVAESPDSVVIRYWRIVGHLAACDYENAEAKLHPVLRTTPYGQRDPIVAAALERIQGPLRWQLQSLEQEVLLNMVP